MEARLFTQTEQNILTEWRQNVSAVIECNDPAVSYPYGWAQGDSFVDDWDDWGDAPARQFDPNTVLCAASSAWNISVSDLVARDRHEPIASARAGFCSLMRYFCPDVTLDSIGRMLDDRGHDTVTNSVQRAARLMSSCPKFKGKYMYAAARVRASGAKQG